MDRRAVDVVVISDVHLGTYGCRAKELLNYLRSIHPNILILNGDIIDGWQFSKRFFPASHMLVIKELMQFVTAGTRVFYITGNHDEMLRRYSDLDIGGFTLTDKLVLEIDHKMTWIFHGDVFDNTTQGGARFMAKLGSHGYGALILFNRLVNGVLRLFGREKVSISKKVMEGVNRAVAKVNDLAEIASKIALEKKYDYVICGHIHEPAEKVFTTAAGRTTYLNSGDWVEHMTSLEYSRNTWKIFRYDPKDFPVASPAEHKPALSVVTDDIRLQMNWLRM